MRSLPLLTIAAVLLIAPPSDAQDRRQRVPPSGESRGDAGGGARAAVPRNGGNDGDSGRGSREAQPAPPPPPAATAAEPQRRKR